MGVTPWTITLSPKNKEMKKFNLIKKTHNWQEEGSYLRLMEMEEKLMD